MQSNLFPGERLNPIYRICPEWSEAYHPDAEDRIHRVGRPPLPKGRFWNSAEWYQMEREERDLEGIEAQLLREWWPKYTERLREPADLTIRVTLDHHEVWCPGWFSHWTYDVGLDDLRVMISFQRYVNRVQFSGRTKSKILGLLMGAEDTGRWCGRGETGDPRGERTLPPCRCDHCKQLGVVRIDH